MADELETNPLTPCSVCRPAAFSLRVDRVLFLPVLSGIKRGDSSFSKVSPVTLCVLVGVLFTRENLAKVQSMGSTSAGLAGADRDFERRVAEAVAASPTLTLTLGQVATLADPHFELSSLPARLRRCPHLHVSRSRVHGGAFLQTVTLASPAQAAHKLNLAVPSVVTEAARSGQGSLLACSGQGSLLACSGQGSLLAEPSVEESTMLKTQCDVADPPQRRPGARRVTRWSTAQEGPSRGTRFRPPAGGEVARLLRDPELPPPPAASPFERLDDLMIAELQLQRQRRERAVSIAWRPHVTITLPLTLAPPPLPVGRRASIGGDAARRPRRLCATRGRAARPGVPSRGGVQSRSPSPPPASTLLVLHVPLPSPTVPPCSAEALPEIACCSRSLEPD